MYKAKSLKLSAFEDEDIQAAKEYLKKCMIGNLDITADRKIETAFEELKGKDLYRGDTLTVMFGFETSSDAILGAIGVARADRIKNNVGGGI